MKQETKDQLREILCEVPEVEKDIKELRMGCKVIYNDVIITYIREEFKDIDDVNQEWVHYFLDDTYGEFEFIHNPSQTPYNFSDMAKIKIIGNKLQERHLRMYCENINLYLIITATGMISYIKKDNEIINTGIKLDNTKDLEDQSEETGQKLINFLLDNK